MNWNKHQFVHSLLVFFHHNWILDCLLINNICNPQKTKKAIYTNTAPNTVLATAGPSSGSFIDPMNDSLFV